MGKIYRGGRGRREERREKKEMRKSDAEKTGIALLIYSKNLAYPS